MQQELKSIYASFACPLKLLFSVPFSMIIKQSGVSSLISKFHSIAVVVPPVQLSINNSDALETLILVNELV